MGWGLRKNQKSDSVKNLIFRGRSQKNQYIGKVHRKVKVNSQD